MRYTCIGTKPNGEDPRNTIGTPQIVVVNNNNNDNTTTASPAPTTGLKKTDADDNTEAVEDEFQG